MTVSIQDGELFDAFLLGWAVSLDLHGLPAPSPAATNIFQAIRDIASGRLTYVDSPADLAPALRAHPEILQDFVDSIPSRIARGQQLAIRLAAVIDEMGVSETPGSE
jgi:hypothetical protein